MAGTLGEEISVLLTWVQQRQRGRENSDWGFPFPFHVSDIDLSNWKSQNSTFILLSFAAVLLVMFLSLLLHGLLNWRTQQIGRTRTSNCIENV